MENTGLCFLFLVSLIEHLSSYFKFTTGAKRFKEIGYHWNYSNQISWKFLVSDQEYFADPGLPEVSKVESFATIVSGQKPLTIIIKRSILDIYGVLDTPLNHGENRMISEIYKAKNFKPFFICSH